MVLTTATFRETEAKKKKNSHPFVNETIIEFDLMFFILRFDDLMMV